MQKLRGLYAQTQRFANSDFDKITGQKIKGYQDFAEKLLNNALSKQHYEDVDEINFYCEKYKEIQNCIQEGKKKFYKKQQLQTEIKLIVRQNPFSGNVAPQPAQTGRTSQAPSFQKPKDKNDDSLFINNNNNIVASKIVQIAQSKSVINSFFDNKKNEIQRSKIGFSNIVEAMPLASRKYAVKKQQPLQSNIHLKPNQNNKSVNENNQQIKKMQNEIQKLKRQLANRNTEKQFNMGLLKAEKQSYNNQIKDLTYQINKLENQNQLLREQSMKNYQPQVRYQPLYPIPKSEPQVQQDSPYCIKYKQNNIYKLSNNFQNSKNPLLINPQPEYRSLKNQAPIIEQNFLKTNRPPRSVLIPNLLEQQQLDYDDKIHEKSAKSSHLMLNRSQVQDETKNIAFRSKISFFKSSIVLYRSDEFDVAIKHVDLIKYESKKITIYVNNKSMSSIQVNINYKLDHSYYNLNVIRKLDICPNNNQGKQQIQVKLINNYDLDSLIQATLTVNHKIINFLIPTMFIEFVNRRPPKKQNREELKIERVNPISSFATLYSAQQIIPSLEKNFDNYKQQTGILYAISKHHQSYINLKWFRGFLQVQTIKPWTLFISYLFLRQY